MLAFHGTAVLATGNQSTGKVFDTFGRVTIRAPGLIPGLSRSYPVSW